MIAQDLCSRVDLIENDARILEDFGDELDVDNKIRLAVEDWLKPLLVAHNYKPHLHRTRKSPTACRAVTGGAWQDLTAAAADGTGFALGAVITSVATDAVYVGLDQPFRGLFVGMSDSVNVAAITASLTYWNGTWASLPASTANGTVIANAPFARAGRIVWPTPSDWLQRKVESLTVGPHYWLRLQINSIPAGSCQFDALLPIVRSRLTQAVALKTLASVYREGAASNRGDWLPKANEFEALAAAQFNLVVGTIADEFDVDNDGVVEPAEVNSVVRAPWVWERG